MKVYRHIEDVPKFKNAIITIGMFDGVHKGHQQVLKQLNEISSNENGESILISFDPHPRIFLGTAEQNLQLLNTINEKIYLLEKYGLQHLILLNFDTAFSKLSAKDFLFKVLLKYIKPKKLIIGYDHRFGNSREGDINLLRKYSAEGNYEVIEIPKHTIDNNKISSTKIRELVKRGQVSKANDLLGNKYMLTGEVVHGKKKGRELGFPTANIVLHEKYKLIPKDGVYATYIIISKEKYKGVLNIGIKPTFNETERTIEVNIFDFERDIYGQTITLELVERLRDEKDFKDTALLQEQIKLDKEEALKLLM